MNGYIWKDFSASLLIELFNQGVYIIIQAHCNIKIWGILFKKQEKIAH